MSEKWTKGPLRVQLPTKWPWDIDILDSNDRVVFSEGMHCYSTSNKTFEEVMSAAGFGNNREEAAKANEESLANAYLRAAAPELYEALKATRFYLSHTYDNDTLSNIDAALSKARGET